MQVNQNTIDYIIEYLQKGVSKIPYVKGITMYGSMARSINFCNSRFEFDYFIFIDDKMDFKRCELIEGLISILRKNSLKNEIWLQIGFMNNIWKIKKGKIPCFIFQFIIFSTNQIQKIPYGFNEMYLKSMKSGRKVIYGDDYLIQIPSNSKNLNFYEMNKAIHESIKQGVHLIDEIIGSFSCNYDPLSFFHTSYSLVKKNVIKIFAPPYFFTDIDYYLKLTTNKLTLMSEIKAKDPSFYSVYEEFINIYGKICKHPKKYTKKYKNEFYKISKLLLQKCQYISENYLLGG
ncbi:MAG: hypothetical protein ACTSYI_17735 [Promethearchaeota archaeon]